MSLTVGRRGAPVWDIGFGNNDSCAWAQLRVILDAVSGDVRELHEVDQTRATTPGPEDLRASDA